MRRVFATIEEVNIGDEIVYKEKYREHGYPNWKVVSKLDKSLLIIEINEGKINEKRIIEFSEVSELVRAVRH